MYINKLKIKFKMKIIQFFVDINVLQIGIWKNLLNKCIPELKIDANCNYDSYEFKCSTHSDLYQNVKQVVHGKVRNINLMGCKNDLLMDTCWRPGPRLGNQRRATLRERWCVADMWEKDWRTLLKVAHVAATVGSPHLRTASWLWQSWRVWRRS